MKRIYLCISLLVVSPIFGGKLLERAKKGIQQVKKRVAKAVGSVKSVVKDPQKAARDASLSALKTIGINVEGIISNVNEVQSSITLVKNDVESEQQALYAPRSPVSKSKSISQKLNEFQKQAIEVTKTVNVIDVKRALGSLDQMGEIAKKVASGQVQTDLNNLYKTYERLIVEIDSVEFRPILYYARKTLYDLAGVLDSALRIRDFAGSLAKTIIPEKRLIAVRDVSKNLRTVAQNLDAIIQGGSRSLQSVQGELANSLMSNILKLPVLVENLQTGSKSIMPKINQINSSIAAAMKAKDRLIRSSSLIGKRLELLMLKKVKSVIGVFDVPRAAVVELKKIMNEIRGNLDSVLNNISGVVAHAADAIQISVDGINAFKKQIKFDVVLPTVRVAFDALPKNVRELSSNINKMRQAIPGKR